MLIHTIRALRMAWMRSKRNPGMLACVAVVGFVLTVLIVHVTLGSPTADSIAMISVAHVPDEPAHVNFGHDREPAMTILGCGILGVKFQSKHPAPRARVRNDVP